MRALPILLPLLQISAAVPSAALSAPLERATSISVRVGTGASSNPLRLQQGAGSPYFFAEPQIGLVRPLGDNAFFIGDASLQVREYSEQDVRRNGRFVTAQSILGLQYFPTALVEIGGDLGYGRYEGRDFAYETNSVEGRPLQSDLYRPGVYVRLNLDRAFALTSYSHGLLRFNGDSQDEGGVRYKDDRTEGLIKAGGGYQLEAGPELSVYATRLTKTYTDRRARFTEGTPNTVLNPLREEELGIETQATVEAFGAKAKALVGFADNRDLIKEANDNRLRRASVGLEMPVGRLMKLEASVGLWDRRFANFVPAPLTDPQTSDRREDRGRTLALTASRAVGTFEGILKASTDDIDSNYALADSREDLVELSLKKAF